MSRESRARGRFLWTLDSTQVPKEDAWIEAGSDVFSRAGKKVVASRFCRPSVDLLQCPP